MEHRKRMLARPALQKAVATEGASNLAVVDAYGHLRRS
jgi:hypothetical protein